jgi:hypothetical protein
MLVNQAWTHLETVCVHHHPKVCQFPHVRSNRCRQLPVQSTATHVDGYLYSLLQHGHRWPLVQSTAVQKLFLSYRMKPLEYVYHHQLLNLQLTCIFCKSLVSVLLNLLRRICCCFLVTSCALVCFTKPALVISSNMLFNLTLFVPMCSMFKHSIYIFMQHICYYH